MGSLSHVLVTFDVDGTLVTSVGKDANRFHKGAFTHAFKEVHGIADASIDEIVHHGLTDALVSARLLAHRGVAADEIERRWPEVAASMVRYAEAHRLEAGDGLQLLPGVFEALSLLKERGAVVGLVTGNLVDIAKFKMEALGIRHLFTQLPGLELFGGFGSDHAERGELVRIAAARARAHAAGITVSWHVGDTPADVTAAQFGGARAIGVCTGVFPAAQLLAANPEAAIFSDLSDTHRLLEVLSAV